MDLPTRPAVVLTREPDDNLELKARLLACGVEVREIPCLATEYLVPQVMPKGRVAALVFTSKRGVRGYVGLASQNAVPNDFSFEMVAAVGRATRDALQQHGFRVEIVADPAEGRVLIEMLARRLNPPARIVWVCGNLRTVELDTVLDRAGYMVEALEVYKNYTPDIPHLDPFPVAAVYVASPSAAQRLVENNPWIKDTLFCAIGPTTAAALGKLGVKRIEQIGMQSEKTVQALLHAYQCAL